MVNVRKRGNVYEYRFEVATVEGTRKWISKSGFKTKSEAFKEGAKVFNNFYYNGNKVQLRDEMSYADFLDYWVDNYASFNLHYTTTVSYINIIKNYVKPKLGLYKLNQLDTRLLQEFINKIYVEYSFSKNYLASILKVIKGSLKYDETKYFSFNNAMNGGTYFPQIIQFIFTMICIFNGNTGFKEILLCNLIVGCFSTIIWYLLKLYKIPGLSFISCLIGGNVFRFFLHFLVIIISALFFIKKWEIILFCLIGGFITTIIKSFLIVKFSNTKYNDDVAVYISNFKNTEL